MSLPKNVLYQNSIESSFARNYNNNIAPQNGMGPYGVGETIIINIPTGRNLVMSGADSLLKIGLSVKNSTNGCNFIRLDKAGIYSIFQRIRVFHGSTLLSDIDNINNLVAMLMCLQQSGDSAKGKMSILAGIESKYVTTDAVSDLAYSEVMSLITGEKLNNSVLNAGNDTTERIFTIPIMNFLSYSDKYIPLFAMTGAPLRIEIQLIDSVKKGICCELEPTSMSVTNVEYICNFMEISDSGMEKIYSSIGGGPLKWVVQDYRNYAYSGNVAPNAELSIPLPAKYNSLRSLFTSMRAFNSGAITYFPLDSNHFGLESYTFRLGSKTVPTKAPGSISEFFGELVRAIGSVSDLNHEPNINVISYNVQASSGNNETAAKATENSSGSSFYLGLDLESYSSSGMDSVYQGYNSSTDDIFFSPKFSSGASTISPARFDTYAYFDQVIIIENGFASVQF